MQFPRSSTELAISEKVVEWWKKFFLINSTAGSKKYVIFYYYFLFQTKLSKSVKLRILKLQTKIYVHETLMMPLNPMMLGWNRQRMWLSDDDWRGISMTRLTEGWLDVSELLGIISIRQIWRGKSLHHKHLSPRPGSSHQHTWIIRDHYGEFCGENYTELY